MNKLIALPNNHAAALGNMHPNAALFMRNKYEGNKISEMDMPEAIKQVRDAIENCFKSMGHWDSSKDEKVLQYQTEQMITDLLTRFKNITIQEFKFILSEGSRGVYKTKKEEILTCSVQSMNQWVKNYLDSETYKMAFNDYHTRLKIVAPKVEPTPEEIEKILETGCNEAYKHFKHTGDLPFTCAPYYDYLKKKGKLVLTKEQKGKYLEKAQNNIRQDLKENRGKLSQIDFKKQMSEIGQNLRTVNECKRLAVQDYFSNLKKPQTK